MEPRASIIDNLFRSRKNLPRPTGDHEEPAEEGGCGVTGFIASVPVSGRHIYEPSVQMHNRGNGKGGGIAAVGISAESLGVPQDILDTHYLLQIAFLDPESRKSVEAGYIDGLLEVFKAEKVPTVENYRDVEGLTVRPPDVWRYFVRVKPSHLDRFMSENNLKGMDPLRAEDEFINQNSFRLNREFYASTGKQHAFVLSHGKNIMVLKIVGYAEQVAQYYLLENFKAHGWIAHQRYPTKGRVWHPGGAHPFIGMHEALVHNGDFANYHAVSEYLKQHGILPLFLMDTEVSILLFDLLNRTFGYPLEYIIEAMAPTTEYDFDLLPPEKQRVYRHIQSCHLAASPDGPWFFIIARNDVCKKCFQLIGITDTAMLRPQVFALQEGEVQIGLICSEKQAIDATLQSLSSEDPRFEPIADRYWNARGGSAADGGAFIFSVTDTEGKDSGKRLTCTNKFGEPVRINGHLTSSAGPILLTGPTADRVLKEAFEKPTLGSVETLMARCREFLGGACDENGLRAFCKKLEAAAESGDFKKERAIEILSHLMDHRFPLGQKRRRTVLRILRESLSAIFGASARLVESGSSAYRYIDWDLRHTLREPRDGETTLVIHTGAFPAEGEDCDATFIRRAYHLGWKRFICYGYRGQRFCGCGLSKGSDGVRIDVYDSPGDYLASGIDGLEMVVHGNGQDQIGQIIKSGKLVIYGDVGQTFMYGAKGGEVYVMGNAAGRPLINAVGSPKVVINGTCLDYLAESFMAGDPLKGGGFVVLNGIRFDAIGKIVNQDTPYPGSNLFSLASGGAIYVRDPFKKVVPDQLNGGELVGLSPEDWRLILPFLKENERLFGISVENDLLKVNGEARPYHEVYRKVQAVPLDVLSKAPVSLEEWGEDWKDEVGADRFQVDLN
ncbi:MAG: glutamate synthase [Desulfobacterales bacterium CG07_land_8_20_14_0_80_52_14]|nr:MAG: glutamate synthase [Desulfobacterales bacterium CG07_land_8_20_14_0_80_52_14]